MKGFIAVLLFVFAFPLFAQRQASNWGNQIVLGTAFTKTDSSRLNIGTVRDSILSDTLYSGILEINDWVDGIWSVRVWVDSLGSDAATGACDSVRVDVRLVTKFFYTDPTTNAKTVTFKYDLWKYLTTAHFDSLYSIPIAQADSSWWQPANGRQYRVYSTSTDTDTSQIKLTDFLR